MKRLLLFGLIGSLALPITARAQSLTLWGAFARSDFEWPEHSPASSVPLGLRATTPGTVQFGVELQANDVLPFEYLPPGVTAETEVFRKQFVQRMAAAVLLIDTGSDDDVGFYLRGAYGIYQGVTRIRFVDGRDDISEEEAFRWGPSVGAGLRVPGFLIEGVYHVIQWEPEAGAGLFKTNSLEGRLGLLLPLG